MKIKTLISVTQKGAHRFITLLGHPAEVQFDVYSLYNQGIIQEIPEDYREGADDKVCVVTSEYRLKKFAYATALSDIGTKGRGKSGKKLIEIINEKTDEILKHLKEVFASEKAPFGTSEAHIYTANV